MKRLLLYLERGLARHAVPHVTAAIALGQVAVLAMLITQPRMGDRLRLVPNSSGLWRLGNGPTN